MNNQIKEEYRKTEVGWIPEGWDVKTFKEISVVRQGLQIPIAERFKEYGKDRYVYITIQHLNNPNDNAEYIQSPRSSVVCSESDILMTRTGNTGQVVTNVHGVFHNNFFLINYNREIIYKDYLVEFLNYEKTQQLIRKLAGTTTIPDLKHGDFYSMYVPIPPFSEQKKIASTLASVDRVIEKTEAIIEKTEEVKKGMMQQLFTKGIGHTQFKKTEIGEIPEKWKVVKLRDVLELITRPLSMKDEEEYQLVTVKRRQGGVVPREILKGKEIKVKSQFYIKTGDFLISKRQIVHGACEVVPLNLDEAIVSNEYHTLLPKSNLDIDFLKWYSRTPLMMNYFLLSSVGVHIEKMLFKVEDWFKRKIVLPPLEEQVEIAKALSSIQKSININHENLNKLQYLKKGLTQSLLTGKVRVKVDEAEVTQV